MEEQWGKKSGIAESVQAKILKPAVPLYPGSTVTYNAVILKGEEWILASVMDMKLQVSWSLVKNDIYGNALAVIELGQGPEISLQIPDEYKNYELLLTVKKDGYVTSSKSFLHTPLIPKKD